MLLPLLSEKKGEKKKEKKILGASMFPLQSLKPCFLVLSLLPECPHAALQECPLMMGS